MSYLKLGRMVGVTHGFDEYISNLYILSLTIVGRVRE